MAKRVTYKNEIKNIMKRLGIFIEDMSFNENIHEIITESIMFISFIIELEQEFDIQIPDEFLLPDNFKTLEQLEEFLQKNTKNNKKSRFYKFIKKLKNKMFSKHNKF